MSDVFVTLMLGAASLGAPVPTDPPPDPLGWGYLGVRVNQGALAVSTVEPNTPAAKAGLQPGDEFVRVGTLKPHSFDEVAAHISSFRPGSMLKVEVRRNGEVKSFTVRLGSRPAGLEPPPVRPVPGSPIPPPGP